ncbi:MAG: hypothetical protein EHM12_11150 [Dehalococcoidia bacterium]|nr:MAG: hypothetical protein EHM12_11150 [Dehalococcoidia bacterium]
MRTLIIFTLLVIFGCCKKTIKNTPLPDNNDRVIEKQVTPIVENEKGIILDSDTLVGDKKNEWRLLYTVKFDLNSSILRPVEKMALCRYTETLKDIDSIILIGGCCPLGDENYNTTLGYKRAFSVYTTMSCLKSKFSVRSVGERDLLCSNSLDCYPENRRCEILIRGTNEN